MYYTVNESTVSWTTQTCRYRPASHIRSMTLTSCHGTLQAQSLRYRQQFRGNGPARSLLVSTDSQCPSAPDNGRSISLTQGRRIPSAKVPSRFSCIMESKSTKVALRVGLGHDRSCAVLHPKSSHPSRELGLWRNLLDDCKASMDCEARKDSFVHSYLTQRAAAGEERAPGKHLTGSGWMQDDFLAYGAGSTLEAGSDTTTSSIVSFILCMLSHPHALQKARAEIDQVVGPDRLPDFDDEERLPYFMACLKESLRLRPATLIGTS